MFDNLKGMAGLAGIMKDLPRLKQKMEEVKHRLGEIIVEAETGGWGGTGQGHRPTPHYFHRHR